MIVIDQYLQEGKYFTTKDLTLNMDKWENGKVNTIFIVGYLGSGKTITGQQLAKQYNAEYIELDSYREDEIDKLMRQQKKKSITDDESSDLWDIVFKRLEDRVRNTKKKLVIEGIDILFMDEKVIFNNAVIVKGTSILKSTFRAYIRNIKYREHTGYRDKSIAKIIWDTSKNQAFFEKHVNKFIKKLKSHL